MIDFAQALLVGVISVLTVILVIIGLQVANILREFKKSLEKVNKILENAVTVSSSIAQPVADISGFFKIINLVVDLIQRKKKKHQAEEIEEEKPEKTKEKKTTNPPRRFFIKGGKKLA